MQAVQCLAPLWCIGSNGYSIFESGFYSKTPNSKPSWIKPDWPLEYSLNVVWISRCWNWCVNFELTKSEAWVAWSPFGKAFFFPHQATRHKDTEVKKSLQVATICSNLSYFNIFFKTHPYIYIFFFSRKIRKWGGLRATPRGGVHPKRRGVAARHPETP
jgi:hypothetical protein